MSLRSGFIRTPLALAAGHALLALPVVAAIVFVAMFASAFPLSDEWTFTHAIVQLQRVDWLTQAGLSSAWDLLPKQFNSHYVTTSFLFYWPIAEFGHFDTRWILGVTLLCFALEWLLIRRYLVRSTLGSLPIAMLLFCPSHHMDFLWGWQLNFSLSALFALAGLVAIDRMASDDTRGVRWRYLLLGIALILLGTFSSAGAFFGLPCAMLLVTLKRFDRREKLVSFALLSIASVLTFVGVVHNPELPVNSGLHAVTCVLTAIGATIWGSIVGPVELEFGLLSITGLMFALCAFAVVIRASIVGVLPRMALALSVTAFGLLCLASVGLVRSGLANWHLHYGLMVPCGIYAAAWLLWKEDRSRYASVPFFMLLILLVTCLGGYVRGFVEYGPTHKAYMAEIENYARSVLVDPTATKIHPPPMDVSLQMLLFLSAHEHPLFPREQGVASDLPPGSRVFVDLEEQTRPFSVEVKRGTMERLTVLLPPESESRSVRAQIDASSLELRRIHPGFSRVPGARDPGVTLYSGLLVPSLLANGVQPFTLSIVR